MPGQPVNPSTTYSGHSDTTRYPGFHSLPSDPAAPVASAGGSSTALLASPDADTIAKIRSGLASWNASYPGADSGLIAQIDSGASLGQLRTSLANLRRTTTNPKNTAFLDPVIAIANGTSLPAVGTATPVAANPQAGTQLSNINSYSAAFPRPTPTSPAASINNARSANIGGLNRIFSAYNSFR